MHITCTQTNPAPGIFLLLLLLCNTPYMSKILLNYADPFNFPGTAENCREIKPKNHQFH